MIPRVQGLGNLRLEPWALCLNPLGLGSMDTKHKPELCAVEPWLIPGSFYGLNMGVPIIIPTKGRGFINHV